MVEGRGAVTAAQFESLKAPLSLEGVFICGGTVMLIEAIEECFGCGGWLDVNGHALYGEGPRAGDGYPKEREQCPFCGRIVTDEEVTAAQAEKMQQFCSGADELPGLPLFYIQRFLGHSRLSSTLNYVGGINFAIREWLKGPDHE
jgi:hypothetical protein